MTKRPTRGTGRDYKVGKGRPPKATRWKPGQSGNRKGRPKGSRNAATMARAELKRKVTVTINGVSQKMSIEEVSFRRQSDKATAGDQKALAFLLACAGGADPTDAAQAESAPPTEQELEIIQDYIRRKHKKDESK